jgi:hypothetical protein
VSTPVLVLLAVGLVASAIALTLDIRTHAPRQTRSRSSRAGDAALSVTTVLAFAAVIAALACSGLDPESAAAAPPHIRVLTTALALAVATIGGGPFAVLALRLATRGTSRTGVHGGILITENTTQQPDRRASESSARPGLFRRRQPQGRGTAPASPSPHTAAEAMGTSAVEVLRGGTTIGILERLAIAGAIVAGFPEAVAVVIAIKGVGRFSELAAPEAKERFIIGTLASFVWACACALVLQ